MGKTPSMEQLRGFTWQHREREPEIEVPWYKNYRVHSALVVGITALMIVAFW